MAAMRCTITGTARRYTLRRPAVNIVRQPTVNYSAPDLDYTAHLLLGQDWHILRFKRVSRELFISSGRKTNKINVTK